MAEADKNKQEVSEPERREFLTRASQVAMAAGLVGGYGAFGSIAARYLYPARPDRGSWQFLMELGRMQVGESFRYRAPAGETINITRQAANGEASDFVALSSTCPHLGCQVHWEEQNERYFCPCHNGTFDPSGVATGGPPGDAGQRLPEYPLMMKGGLVYVQVPMTRLVDADGKGEILAADDDISGPGHDPCLGTLARRGDRA